MKNKKGTTMVEAAVVFPLVILSVFCIIYMIIFFYRQIDVQNGMHRALRQEAGIISSTLENHRKVTGSFPIYQKNREVYYNGNLYFKEQGLLKAGGKTLSGSWFIVKRKKTARYFDLLRWREENE